MVSEIPNWPQSGEATWDGVTIDGQILHHCSQCPEDGPCPRQFFVFREPGVGEEVVLPAEQCRVYWGSHGCHLRRGHPAEIPCFCDCDCKNHPDPDSGCVCAYPYYGPDTSFFGEDVKERGLPTSGE